MRWLTLCVAVWVQAVGVLSARILVVLPFPGKSHHIFSSAVLGALVERGHQVVEYSAFPPSKLIPNYTHVEVHTAFEQARKQRSYEEFMRLLMIKERNIFVGKGFRIFWKLGYEYCEQTFKHEKIKELLNSNEHFDLVVTESTFGQESMLVFGHKFKAPTITLQSFILWSAANRAAGNSLSIAFIPDSLSTVTTDQMTFTERFYNFLTTMITLYNFYKFHLPHHQQIVNKYYPGDTPSLEELVTNVSLYIVNTHPAVEYAQPYTPNIIPVAGISLTQDRTPLPQDIQKFMDDVKEGVIYFSFGTVVPLHVFPVELLHIFVNVFRKVKKKVIWKIDLEEIPGISSNVMIRKWVPQPGILAHPNLVLFITHGGLNSQLEAIRAGVPTVGIPFFGDQPYNVRFNEHHGIGIKVDFKTLSEETLLSALNEVLADSRYRENAQTMSRIFRDRPMSPAHSVVFWTEYVLRHSGARHLQPAAARLTWYQLWLLDVAAVVILASLSLLYITFVVIRKLLCVVLWRANVAKSKKTN